MQELRVVCSHFLISSSFAVGNNRIRQVSMVSVYGTEAVYDRTR
jgi:hypothetical protein